MNRKLTPLALLGLTGCATPPVVEPVLPWLVVAVVIVLAVLIVRGLR